MAKEPNKADNESKSAAIPGGTKASDLPKSAGGTRDASDGTRNADRDDGPATPGLAPVTTDAANSTPNPPTGDAARQGRVPSVPGKDDTDAGEFGIGITNPHGKPRKGVQGEPGGVGGPADVSVREFYQTAKGFAQSCISGQWGDAMRQGGQVISVFADLMDTGELNVFGAVEDGGADESGDVSRLMADARNSLSGQVGQPVAWSGGDPKPESGSPMPLNRSAANPPVGAIDPGTILIVWQAVQKLIEFIKSRRNR